MSFLDADEHLILMDFAKANGEMMNYDELAAFRDAGIRTMQFSVVDWSKIEPRPGDYDWSSIEDRLSVIQKAGFKTLLNCYTVPASCFPDSWYCHPYTLTPSRSVLNPWCQEAQAYQLEFMAMLRDGFNDPDVLVVNSHLGMGETVFINQPGWFEPQALASFRARWGTTDEPCPNEPRTEEWMKETFVGQMLAIQTVLAQNDFYEIWSALHPEIAKQYGLYGNGCKFIRDIYQAWIDHLPEVSINQIWYTCIQHTRTYPEYHALIKEFHLRAYGGAEYCEGLKSTVPFARQNGLAGLIIHPLHPFTGHLTVEPWMLEAIRNALHDLEGL